MFTTQVLHDYNRGRFCHYDLTTSDVGTAEVKVRQGKLKVKIRDAQPNTLYTVWVDFRNRETGELAADYPLDAGALERGVAPAFASTAGVTSGMGLDANAIVTNRRGNGTGVFELDYKLLQPGTSPVVGGELAMQGLNRIGGYWLRQFGVDPQTAASVQLVDPHTGLPLLERSTAQGLTIVGHPDFVTHGHTPGVGGVDHFPGFKGDFPSECLPES
ncbi:MAG: hypothetical protein AAF614_39435 [Chloroflexota bacterium]